tara:strand:+ start:927 stop:1061 length:135 start_codon:yes stop_codon:yes gene_type:complete
MSYRPDALAGVGVAVVAVRFADAVVAHNNFAVEAVAVGADVGTV